MLRASDHATVLFLILCFGCDAHKEPTTPPSGDAPAVARAQGSGGTATNQQATGGEASLLDGSGGMSTAATTTGGSGGVPTPTSGGRGDPMIDWYEMSQRFSNLTLSDLLPNKEMLSDNDEQQLVSSLGAWNSNYARMLGIVATPVGSRGPRDLVPRELLLRKYNTEKMSWFFTTPDVTSYEQQLNVAREFLKGAYRFFVALPCDVVPPIGEPGGTKMHCKGVFYTSWFTAVPDDWKGCQDEGYTLSSMEKNMHGPVGTMSVMKHWTAEMHLAESGQVDKFRLIPAEGNDYTIKKGETATCSDVPHWNPKEPSINTRIVKPGDRLKDGEKNVYCYGPKNAARWQTAVVFGGKECWVDTHAMTRL